MSRYSNIVALSIGLLAASVSAIFIRFCVSPPTVIAFWRLVMAGAVFLGWELIRRGRIEISRRDLVIAVVAAVFLALHFYFWIASLFMTSINASMVLLATQPLFALAIQWVIDRIPITGRNIASLSGGLVGAAILARGDFLRGGLAGQGDIYSIVSAAMAAAYLYVGSRRKSPLIAYTGTVYMISGLMLVGVAWIEGSAMLAARPVDWLWFALLALIPTLLGHTLLNRAMMQFPGYAVNLSTLAEPVLTSILAFIVFGEVMTRWVVAGGLFIVAAIVVEVVPREVKAGVET